MDSSRPSMTLHKPYLDTLCNEIRRNEINFQRKCRSIARYFSSHMCGRWADSHHAGCRTRSSCQRESWLCVDAGARDVIVRHKINLKRFRRTLSYSRMEMRLVALSDCVFRGTRMDLTVDAAGCLLPYGCGTIRMYRFECASTREMRPVKGADFFKI